MTTIEVISSGPLTTIQDLGRPGWAHIGVPRSGAADRNSLRLANRLLGNDARAAALETTLGGPQLRFGANARVALTGARVRARLGERTVPMDTAFEVSEGELLKVGNAGSGLRTYIAFAGGIDVPLVLGSAATDTLTGLGPAPLARGQLLRLAAGRDRGTVTSSAAQASPAVPGLATPDAGPGAPRTDAVPLHVVLGPRDHWFSADAIIRLTAQTFTVTPASSRVGLRLEGPSLERARSAELLSEGVISGAIQVPAGGQPILLLADHPTTGGYPVIAVVVESDLDVAAQLRPGQRLRFAL